MESSKFIITNREDKCGIQTSRIHKSYQFYGKIIDKDWWQYLLIINKTNLSQYYDKFMVFSKSIDGSFHNWYTTLTQCLMEASHMSVLILWQVWRSTIFGQGQRRWNICQHRIVGLSRWVTHHNTSTCFCLGMVSLCTRLSVEVFTDFIMVWVI